MRTLKSLLALAILSAVVGCGSPDESGRDTKSLPPDPNAPAPSAPSTAAAPTEAGAATPPG
ncbi:MAG: hypothetical protein ACO1SV_19140 [Fimbriimonas sp.]